MKSSAIILILFSINCLCKDIISISIDSDNPKNSNESDDHNIKIEISKDKNQSNENEIPISSFSGSLERYEQTGQRRDLWISLQNDTQKADSGYEKYSGRILSSIEETNHLWAETRKDNMYTAKIRTEPESDNIFHDKITSSFEDSRKIPAVMARHNFKKVSNTKRLNDENDEACDSAENSRRKAKIHNKIPVIQVDEMIQTYTYKNYPKVRTPCKNSRNLNANSLHTPGLEIRKLPPCESVNEFPGTVKDNSTIEVSDHRYQAIKKPEESDNDDQETLDDYPYSASVQRKGAHYTSGALIGERWVLSTAAEFFNVRETIKLFRVRVGSVDCKKAGILTPIRSITIHPKFTPGRPAYDISVLKTAVPLQLSSVVKPIGLSRVPGKVVSAKFLTTYWPRIVVKEGVMPPTAKERVKYNSMRVSTQKLIPPAECSKMMAAVNLTLEKSNLCLKPVKIHHSACMPDVGAPVVAVDGLWGITSGWVSPHCPYVLLPTLFTRVSTQDLRNWINEQMLLEMSSPYPTMRVHPNFTYNRYI